MTPIPARLHYRTLVCILPVLALAFIPLTSCGHQAKPSPTNAALNAPEGSPERAPARPDELKPPATPPSPGHIGR